MNSDLERQQNYLIKTKLMEPRDTLVDFWQAGYVERLPGETGGSSGTGRAGGQLKWKKGWAYFTERRLFVVTDTLTDDIIIPYSDIRKLGKCSQGLVPIGIVITYEEPGSKRLLTDRVSVPKRDRWLGFLAEKSGVDIS